MKAESNALVLLKKNQFFSIATFFRKIFFLNRKENLIKEDKEEVVNNQSKIEGNEIITGNLSIEQIRILEKSYQKEIEELERQIRLIEARNKMCEFQLQMYEKEKIQSE